MIFIQHYVLFYPVLCIYITIKSSHTLSTLTWQPTVITSDMFHTNADSVVQLRILISTLARTIKRSNCVVTDLTAPRNAFTALINIYKG